MILLWRAAVLALAIGGVVWMYGHQGGEGFLTDDGYQYMDAGATLAETGCLCAGLAHFDEQVAAGRFPVPFTHFAPGYPLLIAAAMRLGAPVETAALLFPALAYLASVWLLWTLAGKLGASPAMAAGACVLWILHASALSTATYAATESMFIALLLALAVTMVSPPSPRTLIACGALAGFAYWIRYAGLFFLPVAGLYLLWRAWKNRPLRWSAIGGIGVMTALVLTVMIRNTLLIGSWRGGFSGSARGASLVRAVIESLKAAYHLVFGDRAVARLDFWMLLFAAAALYLAWRMATKREWLREVREEHAWIGALAAVYAAGILAAAMQTIAADFTRYYLPLYPLAIACAASILPRRYAALAVIVVAIVGVQSRSLLAPVGTPRHKAAEKALLAEGDARGWILRQTGPSEVIFAGNGQALRYVLQRQRPVVSLISPDYTSRVDDEAGIHALMDRFQSRYLVLFPALSADEAPEQSLNPFVAMLTRSGGSGTPPPPAWLTVAFRTPHVLVFEKKK